MVNDVLSGSESFFAVPQLCQFQDMKTSHEVMSFNMMSWSHLAHG